MDNKNNHKNQHSQSNNVDFSNPPEGYLYCMIPIDEEFLELEPDLDPDYITVRFIGSRRQLVYMQLWTEREAREYNQSFKNEIHAEDRSRRCMVTSPKTGKLIRCPDDRSCIGCPFNDAMKQERASCLSLDQMQEAEIETEAHDNVEDEVIAKDLELLIITIGVLVILLADVGEDLNYTLLLIEDLALEIADFRYVGSFLTQSASDITDLIKDAHVTHSNPHGFPQQQRNPAL